MAMLVRTRKGALWFKVICIVSVCAVYLVSGYFREAEISDSGRHLLALSENCTPPALHEFPFDGFTRSQRRAGFILLHVFIVCYLFILLAFVCDEYFVPAIKKFCENLKMREDVAGATFMAMTSSSPELFINSVGTFVTEGDIGVGAVVGSAVFNVLAVPACCGLFANMVVYLEWWPISRDSMMYTISVILLINFLSDGKIYFHEAFTLILVYAIYILIMICNNPLMQLTNTLLKKLPRNRKYVEILTDTTPLLPRGNPKILETEITLKDLESLDQSTKIWQLPRNQSKKKQIWWVLTWPIAFLLKITTPDCRRYPRLVVGTFTMCVLWIGGASYVISWGITIIGDTLHIPDSVLGLTFLAAGMSVPEAVSSVIVTSQGMGSMGLSSCIASNTFDILLCLGLPWLVKTAYRPGVIQIRSGGIEYSAMALLSALLVFYLSLAGNKFRLDRRVGLLCLGMYFAFLLFASMVELNFFFPVNLPTCQE